MTEYSGCELLGIAYVQEHRVGHYVPLVYIMGLAWLYSINKLSRTVLAYVQVQHHTGTLR
jgi:hypothetical protein